MEQQLVPVRYIGPKERKTDNVADSGAVWLGFGDVQNVKVEVWNKLRAFPDVWQHGDAAMPSAPEPASVPFDPNSVPAGALGLTLEQFLREHGVTDHRHYTLEVLSLGQDVTFCLRREGDAEGIVHFTAKGHMVIERTAPARTEPKPTEAVYVLTHKDGNDVVLDGMTGPELRAFVRENGIDLKLSAFAGPGATDRLRVAIYEHVKALSAPAGDKTPEA